MPPPRHSPPILAQPVQNKKELHSLIRDRHHTDRPSKDDQLYAKKQKVFLANQLRHQHHHQKILKLQRDRQQQYTQDLSYTTYQYKNHKQFRIKIDVKDTFTLLKQHQQKCRSQDSRKTEQGNKYNRIHMNYLQGLSGPHSSIQCSLSATAEPRPDSRLRSMRYLESHRQSIYDNSMVSSLQQARSQQLFTKLPMADQSSILSKM